MNTNEVIIPCRLSYANIWEPKQVNGTGDPKYSCCLLIKKSDTNALAAIRKAIERQYGKEVSDAVRIQYGGSMNPKNVKGLMAQPEIDGGLIGGASLKAPDFSQVRGTLGRCPKPRQETVPPAPPHWPRIARPEVGQAIRKAASGGWIEQSIPPVNRYRA